MSSTVSPSSPEPQQILSKEQQQQTMPEEQQQQTLSEEQQQQTMSEGQQQQTLLNLRVPHLAHTIVNGKRVPHYVLAFSFASKDQFRCAEVNNLRPDLDRSQRETVALCAVRRMLPRYCRVDAVRSKGFPGIVMAIIVASNATPSSLALIHDIDRLKEVQRILGTDKCPKWARLKPAYV